MMKNLSLELHAEPDILETNEIQGLYPLKGCCASFWSLKVKVELSIFQDHTEKGESEND